MHVVIGFSVIAIFSVCTPLLSNGLKLKVDNHGIVNKFQQSEVVHGRQKRESGGFRVSCTDVQKLVDNRIGNMNNASRKLFAEEVKFEEDNKFSLQMTWTGNDNDIERIIVITSEDGMSSVYLSDKTTKKFENISSRLDGATVNYELSLQKHPLVSNIVYVVANYWAGLSASSSLYITVDAGDSFTKKPLPFLISGSLVFHPNTSEYVLADDKLTHNLFLSIDHGLSWKQIKSDVINFKWSTVPNSKDIFVVTGKHYIFTDSTSNVLEKSTDLGGSWIQLYHSVYSFGIGGKFLFASVFVAGNPNERRLVVSTDAGFNWTHVLLPTITPDRFFSILDASEGQIFLHVDEPGDTGKGTLFVSDATGVVFTKSLENHLYPNYGDVTDFYPVESLRSVYIANQLASDNSIHTVISYNRGGDWQSIERPSGVPCEDETAKCYLQIHNAYSRMRGVQANPPLSVPNAVGIILAHGHIASSLQTTDPDVFVSSDGGYSWNLALNGPHHYVIGDHGGLLVAVPADTPTPSIIKFSTDEGRCWISYNFTEDRPPIQFTGLLIEPGNKDMMVAIWGYTEERKWRTYVINFTALIQRRCNDSDYEDWVAHSHQKDGCLLGYKEIFKRLKRDSWCYNGRAYAVSNKTTRCPCTVDDFDCDFGYMRAENADKCVEDASLKATPIHICHRNHEDSIVALGYHKIPGDKCTGDFFPSGVPKVNLKEVCEGYSPTEVSEDLSRQAKHKDKRPNAKTVVVAILIIGSVIAGAVGVTIYARKHRIFTQSYHYMSIRSDESAPLNTSVYDKDSDDEPVLS